MSIVPLIETEEGQAVPLPDEFRFQTDRVSIRRQGDGLVVEPLKTEDWPPDFFESIAIDDPAFARPSQGEMPAAPEFGTTEPKTTH